MGVVLVIVVLAGMYLFRRNVYALVGGAGLLTAAGLGSGIWYIRKKKCRNESIEKENKENVWEEFPKENFYPEHETKAEIAGYCSKSKEDGLTVVLNERTPSGACLQCMDGARDEIYEIEKEITLLGKRKEAVDIWLNIPTVSRVHAKIIHKTEGDYLVDLNSRNGTLMNGKYLNPEEEYFMENECTIIFAQTKFLYLSGN